MIQELDRSTRLNVQDRQALTLAVLMLEAYQQRYGWMWKEGVSGDDIAANARRALEHAD